MERASWSLVRFIIPVLPEINIFTKVAKSTTALGPIMVATAANKVWGWKVEVIDENNYNGPRDKEGLPDHKRLQKENPASVVGFYCGLTSTVERVWELAEFYHNEGAINLAGGWHAHYCPEETLNHNIDIVVHGDGEIIIQQILSNLKEGKLVAELPGISYWDKGEIKRNLPEMLGTPDFNDLPYQDFNLLKFAKIRTYPINRTRGCRMNCEFCSVRGKPSWASGRHLFETVDWLVQIRKARHFFIVDDRLEENIEGTFEFFRLISEKYGNSLCFTVQVRLEVAKNTEFLKIMKKAGVRTVCIGYESPIEQELQVMRKGYSIFRMLEWTKIYHNYGFWIHAMFIFGYPPKKSEGQMAVEEMVKRFKMFINKARFHTIQILHPVPLVGTDLRQRLKKEGRIFPFEIVPWRYYDGDYACFQPDNMSLRELQEIPIKLMKWFYSPLSFFRISLRAITLPLDSLIRGWRHWRRGWHGDIVKYGGYRLIQKWQKRQQGKKFIQRLEGFQTKQNSR